MKVTAKKVVSKLIELGFEKLSSPSEYAHLQNKKGNYAEVITSHGWVEIQVSGINFSIGWFPLSYDFLNQLDFENHFADIENRLKL